jgi:hypothetical protein
VYNAVVGPLEAQIKRRLSQSIIDMPKIKRGIIDEDRSVDLDLSEIVGYLIRRERMLATLVIELARELDKRAD